MIKAGGKVLAREIHALCNQIWAEGKVPDDWTKSILLTIPKKGNLTDCKNYRTIALTSHMGKVLMLMLLNRLKSQVEEYLADEQAGFRKGRNTVQQILTLRLIVEKAKRKNRIVYNCFIDFIKKFDFIKQDLIWATLKSYGMGKRLTQILKDVGERSVSSEGWSRTRKVVSNINRCETGKPNVTMPVHYIPEESDGCDTRQWDQNFCPRSKNK